MNRVRIIGGQWRSRLLRFPDVPDLRPTPDRVRETLFNWLGQDLTGLTCIDLFAGSGALGFEAASRGARAVVLVEHNREAVEALRANAAALHAQSIEVVRGDALEFLSPRGANIGRRAYDLAFLDPPYAFWQQSEGAGAELLSRLGRHLTSGARVYVESPGPMQLLHGWCSLKKGRAGAVHYQLLEATPP